jgi:signal transduction histidine kinase/CheY-like chemotaxis protein
MSSPAGYRKQVPPPRLPGVVATDNSDATAGGWYAGVRALPIVVYLLLFAGALLVPVLVIAASVLSLLIDAQSSALQHEAQRRARTAAAIVAHQLTTLCQTAQALADSTRLRDNELERFRDEIGQESDRHGLRIVLTEATGSEALFDTAFPANAALPDKRVQVGDAVRQAAVSGRTTISDLFYTPSPIGRWNAAAVAPVIREGEIRYFVSAAVPAEFISQQLQQAMEQDGTTVLIADRQGVVITYTSEAPLTAGMPAPDWPPTAFDERASVVAGPSVARGSRLSAMVRLPQHQWNVAVLMPPTAAVPAQRVFGLFAIAGAALIGIGSAAALVFGHRITRSVHSLAALGTQLAHDASTEPKVSAVAEVNQVGRALVNAARSRRELELELSQAHKMEAVGRLTGGIAHDFNNLLTIIIGNLEMLGEDDDRPLTGEQWKLLVDAQESATLSAHLVHQLLAFARRQPLDPVIADVGQLARDTAHLLERTLGETIELTVDAADGLRAHLDVTQFETALLNLAINARDAMANGGTLNIAVTRAHVTDGDTAKLGLRTGAYVAVAVTDTGTGMEQDVLEHAFEPFFTTKPAGVGTGLGLSVVYGIAKQSGGDAWIRSAVGQGTTVEFWIPEAESLPDFLLPEVRTAPSLRARSGGVVLLVDDNPKVRDVAARSLRKLGYVVREAADGPSALDILRQEPDIDVLFTDFIMPGGMTGGDLAQRAAALAPDICVLYTSGYAGIDEARRQTGLNAAWLRKPYTGAQVAEALDDLLSRPSAVARQIHE